MRLGIQMFGSKILAGNVLGPSSRPFLREMIAKPDSPLSKYPLETNLVVTNITTLFQLAIYQHLLGKDFFPFNSQLCIFPFGRTEPNRQQEKSIENPKAIFQSIFRKTSNLLIQSIIFTFRILAA